MGSFSKEKLIPRNLGFGVLGGYLLTPTAKARDRGILQTTSLNKNCSVGLIDGCTFFCDPLTPVPLPRYTIKQKIRGRKVVHLMQPV